MEPTHKAFATTFTSVGLLGYNALSQPNNFIHLVYKPDIKPISATSIFIIIAIAWLTSILPDIDMILKRHHVRHIPFKHRGLTHSIWPVLMLIYGCFYFQHNQWLFLILLGSTFGWISHLIADAYSKAGIAWLYPFTQYKRYANGNMTVKKYRKFFIPLYRVGVKVGFCDAKYYYYFLTICLLLYVMVLK